MAVVGIEEVVGEAFAEEDGAVAGVVVTVVGTQADEVGAEEEDAAVVADIIPIIKLKVSKGCHHCVGWLSHSP